MDVEQELLPLLKQLAEGVLKQRIAMDELKGRVARLEHVLANTPANIQIRGVEGHIGQINAPVA